MSDWSVAEAKAKLSEVIARAAAGAPQTITRNRKPVVVVVAAGEWKRRTERKGSLADFLMRSPLRDSGLRSDRIRGKLRDGDVG